MRLLTILLALSAASAQAQVPTLSFDAWKSLPLSAGSWSYLPTASGSEARYAALLTIRCDRPSRTVTIVRPGIPAGPIMIATSSANRTVTAGAKLAASDSFLDAIAFSRGRILISGGAGGVVAIPSWPEAARSIEDCRN
jgi:hypothetical protein